jgi:hypothetical protein
MDDSSLKIPTPAIPPVKPALKHPAKNDPMESDDKKEKHLTWDEHAIEEHDVLRGTRMKVGSHCLCLRMYLPVARGQHCGDHGDE